MAAAVVTPAQFAVRFQASSRDNLSTRNVTLLLALT